MAQRRQNRPTAGRPCAIGPNGVVVGEALHKRNTWPWGWDSCPYEFLHMPCGWELGNLVHSGPGRSSERFCSSRGSQCRSAAWSNRTRVNESCAARPACNNSPGKARAANSIPVSLIRRVGSARGFLFYLFCRIFKQVRYTPSTSKNQQQLLTCDISR